MNTLWQDYTVRYETDGDIAEIGFNLPKEVPGKTVVLVAMGLLFQHDFCPGEKFCVYKFGDRNQPVDVFWEESHYHYGDDDDLWASAEDWNKTVGDVPLS